MPRKPRKVSKSGIYFVYLEAAFGIRLFSENDDFNTFLKILIDCKNRYACDIFSYALCEKDVYMLIRENEKDEFSKFMRTALSTYAVGFNRKYLRNGAITADRFKSVPIETDADAVNSAIFIHKSAKSKFSSKIEYFDGSDGLCSKEYILNIISIKDFKKLHDKKPEFLYIPKHPNKFSDEKLRKIITKYTGENPEDINNLPRDMRDEILRTLRKKEGLTISEINKITGVSRGIITRAYNSKNPVKVVQKKKHPDTTNYKVRNDLLEEKFTEKDTKTEKEEIWLL